MATSRLNFDRLPFRTILAYKLVILHHCFCFTLPFKKYLSLRKGYDQKSVDLIRGQLKLFYLYPLIVCIALGSEQRKKIFDRKLLKIRWEVKLSFNLLWMLNRICKVFKNSTKNVVTELQFQFKTNSNTSAIKLYITFVGNVFWIQVLIIGLKWVNLICVDLLSGRKLGAWSRLLVNTTILRQRKLSWVIMFAESPVSSHTVLHTWYSIRFWLFA